MDPSEVALFGLRLWLGVLMVAHGAKYQRNLDGATSWFAAAHPEPYLYLAPLSEIDRSDPFWNDTTFNGASLSYREILASDDQLEAALSSSQGPTSA